MSSIISLDIGEKRIGVAIAEVSAPFPHPLLTLEASASLTAEFQSLLTTNHVSVVVIGLPRNQQGERTKQTERAEHVAKLLNIPSTIAVYWQDESLTSVKAENELGSRGKAYSKADVDALAATYILEDFLAEQRTLMAPSETPQVPLSQEVEKPVVKKKPAKTKARKRKWTPWAFVSLGVVLLALGIGSLIGWYNAQLQPRSAKPEYHLVTISTGMSTSQIAQKLEAQQVIKNAQSFKWYIKLHHITGLQAGDYRLSSDQSVASVTAILTSGKVTSLNVLIAPGLRLDQIKLKLESVGYSQSELEKALTTVRAHPLLSGVSASTPPEGYLFPDTYKIGPDTSAEALLTLIVDNFADHITPEIKSGLANQGLSLAQGVILASIVQKEVSNTTVQKTVAQVFIKRLNEGRVLGSDVTFQYGAHLLGVTPTPDLVSPYNTRKYAGLPPSAISNFNITALEAVAHPTATDYNYFVAGDDGHTYFAHTEAEHEANVANYCKKLCN